MRPLRQLLQVARRSAGRIFCFSLLAATTGGCRTAGGGGVGKANAVPDEAFGYVVRVNSELGFVILDCLVPPQHGEELAVWRGDTKVAWIRATERRRPPFVAADLIAGEPRRGDVARAERIMTEATAETQP